MSLRPEKHGKEEGDNLSLWGQIPLATKLYFSIIIGLFLLFAILFMLRGNAFSNKWIQIEWSSIRSLLPMKDDFQAQIPTPAPDEPTLLSSGEVAVFVGPGTSYEELGTLPQGRIMQLIGKSEDSTWWAVKLTDEGQIGWVESEMVEINNEARVPVLNAGGDKISELVDESPSVVSISNTQIFFGPGPDFGVIGFLEGGQQAGLVATDPDGAWWVIQIPYVEGGLGWVAKDQVVANNAANIPIATADVTKLNDGSSTEEGQQVSAIENVNIRSGPGLGYIKIGIVAKGQQVEAIGVSADGFWLAIRYPKENIDLGWISADYVIPQDFEDLPVIELELDTGALIVPTPKSGSPTATALNVVNIRGGPGLQFEVLGRLEIGQQAEILGISPNKSWWLISIKTQGKDRGWVAVNFVKDENTVGVPIIE